MANLPVFVPWLSREGGRGARLGAVDRPRPRTPWPPEGVSQAAGLMVPPGNGFPVLSGKDSLGHQVCPPGPPQLIPPRAHPPQDLCTCWSPCPGALSARLPSSSRPEAASSGAGCRGLPLPSACHSHDFTCVGWFAEACVRHQTVHSARAGCVRSPCTPGPGSW